MKSNLANAFLRAPHNPVGLDSAELFNLPMMVPADFAMEYTSGPVRTQVGPRSFVRLQPLAARTWLLEFGERAHPQSADRGETVDRVLQIGQSDVLELYQEVIVQDFFDLRASYTNPAVFAGGCSSLRVVANGDTKFVLVSNTTVEAFRDVVAMLYSLGDIDGSALSDANPALPR